MLNRSVLPVASVPAVMATAPVATAPVATVRAVTVTVRAAMAMLPRKTD